MLTATTLLHSALLYCSLVSSRKVTTFSSTYEGNAALNEACFIVVLPSQFSSLAAMNQQSAPGDCTSPLLTLPDLLSLQLPLRDLCQHRLEEWGVIGLGV